MGGAQAAEHLMPDRTLLSFLEFPTDSPALMVDGADRVISRQRLLDDVHELACALEAGGVGDSSRVAIAVNDGARLIETVFAAASLGAASAPLNPAYTAAEFEFYLRDLAPEVLVLPARELAAAREAAAAVGVPIAELATAGDYAAELLVPGIELSRRRESAGARPGGVALLLHTSGTTSRPKQVPLLHRNLVSSVHTIVDHYRLAPGDVSYCLMPLFHVHGLVATAWATLASGGTVVVPVRRAPRLFWKSLTERSVTWVSASPTIHQMMIENQPDLSRDGTLRFIRSCSSALSERLQTRLEDLYAVPVLQAYGMTEASHQISSNPLPPAQRVVETVGIATGTEVNVIGDTGIPVAPGASGHVVIRGPGITPGYFENPEANAEAFFDGWFRTGDIGSVDENGYLRLLGRAKELIIRGGENISPFEVEEALLAHTSVVDAVAFSVPDDKYGEVVGAAVVVSGGVTDAALRAFCGERLSSFKVPSRIFFIDSIPRTPTGKLQRSRMYSTLAPSDR